MTVGGRLRDARERRGLTLQQIADVTKLSTAALRAIEQNHFERLPAGIFTRGYLRAYAAEVGEDPEDVVRAYLAQAIVGGGGPR